MSQKLIDFLTELASLMDKYEAEIEIGDFTANLGVFSSAGFEWSGCIDEITPHELRLLINRIKSWPHPTTEEITMTEFAEFPKMPRLSREVIITEKIDGTNAQICITEDGQFLTGSRTRWITPEDDNFGFAKWAQDHREELMELGPGRHFGEWWGVGIQRNYGLSERRFSLFNVSRWGEVRPACCHVVPVLYRGPFDTAMVNGVLLSLSACGSVASPGFMKPEGIIVFHTAANMGFKKTIEKDEVPKSMQGKQAA